MGKKYVVVHIPKETAERIGATATRAGVPCKVAIATAIDVFGRLSLLEKERLIAAFLSEYFDELPPEEMNHGPTV